MKKKILIFWCSMQCLMAYSVEPWTWSLHKTIKESDFKKNSKHIIFSHMDLKPFSQMLFSWNAQRPKQGFYTFWAQVRDVTTKQWHPWHKMIEWGNGVNRSFFDAGKHDTSKYCHVRLEVPDNKHADAVRFIITPHDGAGASLIKKVDVTVSNFAHFISEVGDKKLDKLSSVHIKNIPIQSQMVLAHDKKEVLCSPTSMSMLVGFLTKKTIKPELFSMQCYDTGLDAYGSWPFNIAHANEVCKNKYHLYVTRLPSFLALHKKLKENIPVVVSVRGAIKNAPKEYKHGHLLLVVGYDHVTKKVIVHDPAFSDNQEVVASYELGSFLQAWEKSRRLSYVAEPL